MKYPWSHTQTLGAGWSDRREADASCVEQEHERVGLKVPKNPREEIPESQSQSPVWIRAVRPRSRRKGPAVCQQVPMKGTVKWRGVTAARPQEQEVLSRNRVYPCWGETADCAGCWSQHSGRSAATGLISLRSRRSTQSQTKGTRRGPVVHAAVYMSRF